MLLDTRKFIGINSDLASFVGSFFGIAEQTGLLILFAKSRLGASKLIADTWVN